MIVKTHVKHKMLRNKKQDFVTERTTVDGGAKKVVVAVKMVSAVAAVASLIFGSGW